MQAFVVSRGHDLFAVGGERDSMKGALMIAVGGNKFAALYVKNLGGTIESLDTLVEFSLNAIFAIRELRTIERRAGAE